jgi:hypothetical protein
MRAWIPSVCRTVGGRETHLIFFDVEKNHCLEISLERLRVTRRGRRKIKYIKKNKIKNKRAK